MNFLLIPEVITVNITFGVTPELLAVLERPAKIQALADRLHASNVALQAVIAAHPDPDTTD